MIRVLPYCWENNFKLKRFSVVILIGGNLWNDFWNFCDRDTCRSEYSYFPAAPEGTKPIAFKGNGKFQTLNHVTYPNLKAETNPVSDDVVAALKASAVQTVPNIFEERGGRTMYTLLWAYSMALAMLLEGIRRRSQAGTGRVCLEWIFANKAEPPWKPSMKTTTTKTKTALSDSLNSFGSRITR